MDKKTLIDLIKNIICLSSEREIILTRTPLIKLLYLIDVEYYRATGHELTGIDWIFYKYGPYAFELEEALSAAGISEDVGKKDFSLEGKHGTAFRSSGPVAFPLEDALARGITQEIVREWADKNLDELLNHVYFYTEPMKYAKARGEKLDFSRINRKQEERYEVRLNQKRLDELNARLRAVSDTPRVKEKIQAFISYGIRSTYYWAEDDISLTGDVLIDPTFGEDSDEL